MGEYTVMWQFPKTKAVRANYAAHDLKDLLKILERTEGVSEHTCDKLFVHYHTIDGNTLEVVSHDKENTVVSPVTTTVSYIKKPRIRFKSSHKVITGGNGLYLAHEAA